MYFIHYRLCFLIMDNNHIQESHTSTMAGQSADVTITGADNNNRLERLLIQMNTMSSNMEKVLSEIPKACSGAKQMFTYKASTTFIS